MHTAMPSYQHRWLSGAALDLPVGKAVCVGRNYAEHARELSNPVPTQPLLFLKPSTACVAFSPSFSIPSAWGSCHHELELAILIGKPLRRASEQEVADAIVGATLCLDLTLRDRQAELKSAGHPWEEAKAFDGSLPLAPFLTREQLGDLNALEFRLFVNDNQRQYGKVRDMLNPILPLIAHMSARFTLLPGDVICTGTPAGVGALADGDDIRASLGELAVFTSRVTLD